MRTIEQAKAVLVEAETALRTLMEEGIRQHRYAEVGEIAGLADGLSRLLLGGMGDAQVESVPNANTPERNGPTGPEPSRTTKGKARGEFPRFEREGDKLIKVGWSKKNRDQYEHRASRETVIGVTRHLASRVKPGQVFEASQLLPIPDAASGQIPEYQVYLVLAWLRSEGAVEKRGRDGHVLRTSALAEGGLDKLWNGLPVRAA